MSIIFCDFYSNCGQPSAKKLEELDCLEALELDDTEILGLLMQKVHQKYGTKILGGCCGSITNHRIYCRKIICAVRIKLNAKAFFRFIAKMGGPVVYWLNKYIIESEYCHDLI